MQVIDKEVSEPSDSENSSNGIRASPKLLSLLKNAAEESSSVEVIAVVICRLEGCNQIGPFVVEDISSKAFAIHMHPPESYNYHKVASCH